MSWKSIGLSILSLILFAAVMFGIVNIFKYNILFGFLGILLLMIPAGLQRKALDEASGTFDRVFAKFIVPALAVAIGLFFIMAIALWMN